MCLSAGTEDGDVARLRRIERQPRLRRNRRRAGTERADSNCAAVGFGSQPIQHSAQDRATEWRVEIEDSSRRQFGVSDILRDEVRVAQSQLCGTLLRALDVRRLEFNPDRACRSANRRSAGARDLIRSRGRRKRRVRSTEFCGSTRRCDAQASADTPPFPKTSRSSVHPEPRIGKHRSPIHRDSRSCRHSQKCCCAALSLPDLRLRTEAMQYGQNRRESHRGRAHTVGNSLLRVQPVAL